MSTALYTKTMTKTQTAARIAQLDANIAAVSAALEALNVTIGFAAVEDSLGDAWNALHDAERILRAERDEVANPRRVIRSGLADLVAANID